MSDAPALSAIFLGHRGGSADRLPSVMLETNLQACLRAAAAAWPGLELAAPVFVRHLADRLAEEVDPEKGLDSVNAGDLYLACACLHAVPGAIEAFDRSFLSRVPAFVSRVDPSPAFADEVRQVLRERLLVGQAGSPPHIAGYSGQGALLKWVRVAAVRTALNLQQQRERQFAEGRKPALAGALAATQSPELAYLKERYRSEFQEAFQAALAALSSEERNLLRLRFIEGLGIDRIAELFHVHRATVVRKLARARQEVYDRTQRLLRQGLRLSDSEFDLVAKLVRSQLNISISRCLNSGA